VAPKNEYVTTRHATASVKQMCLQQMPKARTCTTHVRCTIIIDSLISPPYLPLSIV